MQTERRSQMRPQDVQIVRLVPEQAIPIMQQALINMLRSLPTPITITQQKDTRQKTYYTYQVGEKTEDRPAGLAIGATPDFFDAVRFALEIAMKRSPTGKH